MIRKEAWPFYRTISGVRLRWMLEEPKGPKGQFPVSAYVGSSKNLKDLKKMKPKGPTTRAYPGEQNKTDF